MNRRYRVTKSISPAGIELFHVEVVYRLREERLTVKQYFKGTRRTFVKAAHARNWCKERGILSPMHDSL